MNHPKYFNRSGLWVNTPYAYILPFRIIYIGSISISIVCVWIVAIYIFYKRKHRTLPGKNFLCISSSILLTQIPLFGELVEWKLNFVNCYFAAVISQLGELSIYFWLNVLAYDIWRATVDMRTQTAQRQGQRLRFLFYCLYGWLCPATFVGISILVDNIDSVPDELKPDYVEDGYRKCWMSTWAHLESVLIYICLPRLPVILARSTYLIIGYRNLVKSRTQTGSHQNKKLSNRFACYLRLAVIKDVTFLVNHIPFWETEYVIISNILFCISKLIGFYVLVVYFWHKKVMKEVRTFFKKCCCIRKSVDDERDKKGTMISTLAFTRNRSRENS